jgi:hypothetical protein
VNEHSTPSLHDFCRYATLPRVTETPPAQPVSLIPRVLDALIWIAAFSFASGIFLSLTLLTRGVPPTAPVAVGRITIDHYAKGRDYLNALLFFLSVPPLTIFVARLGRRFDSSLRRETRRVTRGDSEGLENLASLLFITPFFLAPFLYLTTFKWGWALLIPIALSQALPRVLILFLSRQWVRSILAPRNRPWHALLFCEALAWILFRYVAVGRRIAHIPTLFLEIVFVALMIAMYWFAAVLVARLAAFCLGGDPEVRLQGVAFAGLPLLGLPPLALFLVDSRVASGVAIGLMLLLLPYFLTRPPSLDRRRVRAVVAWVILPMLLYAGSYASTAALSQWIDLFHRGESLGPASDYLQGKVPYRDVFVLHGLMEDGMLDAWLMNIFGRDLGVALVRPVLLGSCAVPALWFLAMSLFDSIPLAFAAVGLGMVTTVDNERTFFEIAVVALLMAAMRSGRRWLIGAAGAVAGIALFFSLDIGLYSIAAAVSCLVLEYFIVRRGASNSAAVHHASLPIFAAGAAVGMLPFVLFLAARGAFADFLETSFRTIPAVIDAVWSIPYPDLTATFRTDLNLHTISDFLLFEPFRFVLNPLVIAIATAWLIRRVMKRSFGPLEHGLLVVTVFALVTQRSALGRADFRHQYFSAFLIGPMILILIVLMGRASRDLWAKKDRTAQAFLVLAAFTALPFLVIALWIPDLLNARIDDTIRYRGRLAGQIPEPAAEKVADRIRAVTVAIGDMTHATDTIFDFSNQPALYFFARRMNPTRFYQIPIVSPPQFQREAILAVERSRPKVVIRKSPEGFDTFDGIDNRLRAPSLAAYIEDHYRYASTVRGIELWQRLEPAPPLHLAHYMSLNHIPTAREAQDASRERFIIPSIGSLPGIDSYWRSDLVIHNPFRVPLTLRLRYVSDARKVEKSVRLGKGQIIRWDDVVSSYFFAPGSIGMLWIDYPSQHPPVCRVRTYDASREAKASIYGPLSMKDSATAGAELSDLTLVGLAAGNTRRVNLGVVNVGDGPLTVRITVRNARGGRVGRVFDRGITEDEPFFILDAARTLGVALDESVAVHVEMIAGTGVAYATVVDGATGDSQFVAAVPTMRP